MSKKDDALTVIADAEQKLTDLVNQGHDPLHQAVQDQFARIRQAIKDGGDDDELKHRGRLAGRVVPPKHSGEFPPHEPE